MSLVIENLLQKYFAFCAEITLFLGFLRYAARVKLITNDASKNADNKEIIRLKNVSKPIANLSTLGDF